MDFDFEELYQAVILDHSRKPRNFGPLPDATVTVSGDNPTCGDEISLSLKIDPAEGKLEAVGFTGSACSICMASTSLMTIKIKGKTRGEAAALLEDFQGMITGQMPESETPKSLGDLRLLSGVRKFPQRVKCATLGWHALRDVWRRAAERGSSASGRGMRTFEEGWTFVGLTAKYHSMKERIRDLLHTVPFQPFVIYMADGRTFHVNHPDFVLAPPTNQSWVIVADENKDRLHQLSALLMTGVEYASDTSVAS